jgi:hypothetical protein
MLKVKELIEKLSKEDPEAECYYESFHGFLDENLNHANKITDKEWCEVYDIDFEYKTVYHWSTKTQKLIPYTGVIFE